MINRAQMFLGLAIATGIVTPVSAETKQAQLLAIPKSLQSSIGRAFPGTRVTDSNDLEEECKREKQGGKQPSLVAADFNGDGVLDYAVVLQYTKPRKHREYGMIHDYAVVAFLGVANKEFKPFKIWEFESTEKTLWFIKLYKEKILVDHHSGAEIPLKYPALSTIRCGGGYGTYYWIGNGFAVAGGS